VAAKTSESEAKDNKWAAKERTRPTEKGGKSVRSATGRPKTVKKGQKSRKDQVSISGTMTELKAPDLNASQMSANQKAGTRVERRVFSTSGGKEADSSNTKRLKKTKKTIC
jgi:hypothetical protein